MKYDYPTKRYKIWKIKYKDKVIIKIKGKGEHGWEFWGKYISGCGGGIWWEDDMWIVSKKVFLQRFRKSFEERLQKTINKVQDLIQAEWDERILNEGDLK